MAEIIGIDSLKAAPHNSGLARCMVCKHEHQAVAPVGVVWMECPECHAQKALFVGSCERRGEAHWTCACGNDLFHATPEGFYCPNCGEWQKGF